MNPVIYVIYAGLRADMNYGVLSYKIRVWGYLILGLFLVEPGEKKDYIIMYKPSVTTITDTI